MAGDLKLLDIVYLEIYCYVIMSLIIFIALGNACGSGSVVERHLAKVNVASSNLVFRSNASLAQLDRATPF